MDYLSDGVLAQALEAVEQILLASDKQRDGHIGRDIGDNIGVEELEHFHEDGVAHILG